MKTKVLLTLLSLLLVLSFVSCGEDGDSMNEDYAGTWYGTWFDGSDIKVDLTDTSYEAQSLEFSGWEYADKGDIEKTGTNSLTVTTTAYYENGWVPCNYTSLGTYSVSTAEGSTTLTLDITYTNAPDAMTGTRVLYSSNIYE